MRSLLIGAGLVVVAAIAGYCLYRYMQRRRLARLVGGISAGRLGILPLAGMGASSGQAVQRAVDPPKNVPLETGLIGSPGLRLMRQV